jgi:hypothetical protein
MTDQADNTHSPAPATEPLALRLNEGSGSGREAFECWYRDRSDHYEWVCGLRRRRRGPLKFGAPGIPEDASRYHDEATQESWEGWQAGRENAAIACDAAAAELRGLLASGVEDALRLAQVAEDLAAQIRGPD